LGELERYYDTATDTVDKNIATVSSDESFLKKLVDLVNQEGFEFEQGNITSMTHKLEWDKDWKTYAIPSKKNVTGIFDKRMRPEIESTKSLEDLWSVTTRYANDGRFFIVPDGDVSTVGQPLEVFMYGEDMTESLADRRTYSPEFCKWTVVNDSPEPEAMRAVVVNMYDLLEKDWNEEILPAEFYENIRRHFDTTNFELQQRFGNQLFNQEGAPKQKNASRQIGTQNK